MVKHPAPRGQKVAPKPKRRAKPPVKTKTATVAAKPAPRTILGTLFAGLDAAFEEASARVAELEAQLEVARREMAAVSALKAIREGGELPLPGRTGRAPKTSRQAPADGAGGVSGGGGRSTGQRGETPRRVMALLAEHPEGLPAGVIIDRLNADDKAKASIRNVLALGKRNGSLVYTKSTKAYALA